MARASPKPDAPTATKRDLADGRQVALGLGGERVNPNAGGGLPQAALTELRNLLTSSLRRLESPDSDCAAERTCDEAEPVSLAPR